MYKRGKTITFGDKIFARVTRNGRTVYNFVSEKVADMTDLIGQLRLAMKGLQGLVTLHIRNYNQGWGEERPLMLYAERVSRYADILGISSDNGVIATERNMIFPWETH